MQGVVSFLGPQSVEQELPLLRHSHPVEFDRTSGRNAHRFTLKSGFYGRIYAAVLAVAAIIWLIALAWRCLFSRSRGSTSGHRRRRLASGGGQQGEDEGEENPHTCKMLEEVLELLEEEDSASSLPAPQATGISVGAAADKEQPKKRKEKTKRLAEGPDETSEEQAKRARLEEGDTDDELEKLESFLFSFKDPNSSSSPAPPFSPQSAEPVFEDTLETRIRKGTATLVDWVLDSENDVPLTTEEQHRPEGSADSSPLEGTSSAFPFYLPSQAMESRSPREPPGDKEMPSTSSAVSEIQRLSSQPSLPESVEAPQPSSLLEASAAPSEGPLIPFKPENVTTLLHSKSLLMLLDPVERLLRKKQLSNSEKQALISHSEILYAYATSELHTRSKQVIPNRQLRVAAHRLLAADGLWRACEAVGPAMKREEWWPKLMVTIYGGESQWRGSFARSSHYSRLLGRVVAALECYSQGRHPEYEELVVLKRELFNRQTGVRNLRGSEWDLWREEDKDS